MKVKYDMYQFCNIFMAACVSLLSTGFGVALSDVAMTAHGITVEKLKQTIEMGKFGALNGIGKTISSP